MQRDNEADLPIGYDREGDGPAIILVGGAFQYRAFDPPTVALASALAEAGLTVINYDRLGRGGSVSTGPYTLDRELAAINELAALVDGPVSLFGSSSGSAIALAAAAGGLAVDRLILWEAPLGPELGTDGVEFLAGLRTRIGEGDMGATVAYFMKDMPSEWLESARQGPAWSTMTSIAPSLEPDSEALAWTQSAPHRELWASITAPTLVLTGEQTLPVFASAADAIVAAIPTASQARVPGANHSWELAAMTSTIADFVLGRADAVGS